MTKLAYDKDGKLIEDEKVIPDGGHLRVAMPMMDANTLHSISANLTDSEKVRLADALNHRAPSLAAHQPGFAGAMTDAERTAKAKAIEDRSAAMSERWRTPPALDASHIQKTAPTASPAAGATASDADALHAERSRRLESAWRGGV